MPHPINRPPPKKFQVCCPRDAAPAGLCKGQMLATVVQEGHCTRIVFACLKCGHDMIIDIDPVAEDCLLQAWLDKGEIF